MTREAHYTVVQRQSKCCLCREGLAAGARAVQVAVPLNNVVLTSHLCAGCARAVAVSAAVNDLNGAD